MALKTELREDKEALIALHSANRSPSMPCVLEFSLPARSIMLRVPWKVWFSYLPDGVVASVELGETIHAVTLSWYMQ